MEKATFAAGCFWGVENSFRQIKGVKEAISGYTGGAFPKPAYADVCGGDTGHAEAVEVTFDPAEISFGELLSVFWEIHNPTTLNRQGPDRGSQYRSAIFYHTPEQKTAALASKERLEESGSLPGPVVTQIAPATEFFPAEEYHQRYLEKSGRASCHL